MKFNEGSFLGGANENLSEVHKFEKTSDIRNRALKKAEKVLEIDKIDEHEFNDLYSKELVDKDLEYVREKEERFKISDTPRERELEKTTKIFEAIIHEQIEVNNWLGEDTFTKKSARYDDIKNGVDEIVEFRPEDISKTSHLALAVDVIFSDDLVDKMEKIKDDIAEGKLSTIKYFKSDSLNIRGEKKNVPKVIIGADGKMLNEIIKLWVNCENKKLADHPIKFLILEEVLVQLRGFKEYAIGANQIGIADDIDKVLKIVEEIYSKEFNLSDQGEVKKIINQDKVFNAIKKLLGRVRKKEVVL